MPLSRPGSLLCSFPFYIKKATCSGMHGAPPSYRLVLISCSYEFMRKKLIFYRTEIHRRTGKVRLSKLDSG